MCAGGEGHTSLPWRLPVASVLLPQPPLQNVASQLKGSPCQLIVTESSHVEGPRLLYILQRWLPLVLHIRRERPAGSPAMTESPDPGSLHALLAGQMQ